MDENKELYKQLGVSSRKEDVHNAIQSLDKGLFPGAFCKIVKDIAGRSDYCSIFHADGAGTKANLAYLYFKETGDLSVFRGIVQDAIVMNIDDMICVGATDTFLISNTLGRNSQYINGNIVNVIIDEYQNFSDFLTTLGIPTILCGGETADVGDIVKTLLVDASAFTTMRRDKVIDASKIQKDDVIIGFSSSGKAKYEKNYNSGIGSNGLTLARHGTLSHKYYPKYPEAYDNNLSEELIFWGKHNLNDTLGEGNLSIGKALLSPTRTYSPIIKKILNHFRNDIHGIIHNTGGGQTKVLNYAKGLKIIKNNLFKLPKIFEVIQNSSETQWEEMFHVFNMGNRMELYCDENITKDIISIANDYHVDAKIIGYCEKNEKKAQTNVEIQSEYGNFKY